jgi:hypothetical protein
MTTRTMLIETTTTILVERSFADLITAIEGATMFKLWLKIIKRPAHQTRRGTIR